MTLREKIRQLDSRYWVVIGMIAVMAAALIAWVATPSSANAAAQQQAAAAAAARGLSCTQTDKANGGFILDCDPADVVPSPSPTASAPPSPSPSVSSSPTASPTASPSGSPTATPSPTGACIPVPSSCGFPDATNTGPKGALTVVQGNVRLGTAGQVYEGKDVRGCIEVAAANVTIRNVKVTCAQYWGIYWQGSSRLLVEDTTVVCTGAMGNGGGRSIGDANYTARRVNVSGCADGFNADHDVLIEDSYCHDLPSELTNGSDNGLHVDCIQGVQTTNVTIRHNTLIAPFYSTSAIGGCCIPGSSVRNNWQVVSNLLDGGGFTIYCFRAGTETNSQVSGNRFGPGGWNHSYADDCNDGGLVWSGNVRDGSGAALAAM